MSPAITARIKIIAKEMANGKDRAYILSKYAKLWGKSRTSLDRYMDRAKDLSKDIAKKQDKVLEDATLATMVDAAKNGLKSVLEVDLKLQKIIFDTKSRPADQVRAIDIYYKRHGYYEIDNNQKGPQSITINGREMEF